jgi:outer membrane protein TolC
MTVRSAARRSATPRSAARIAAWLPTAGVLGLIASCAVGPDYKRPPFGTAPVYKEEEGWKPSEPSDAMNRGPWWTIFHDQVLDQLEARVDVSNENVKAAVAAYDQAKALVDQARAGFWPTLSGGASRIRSQSGAGSFTTLPTGTGATGASAGSTVITARSTTTTYSAGVTADWTLDI